MLDDSRFPRYCVWFVRGCSGTIFQPASLISKAERMFSLVEGLLLSIQL